MRLKVSLFELHNRHMLSYSLRKSIRYRKHLLIHAYHFQISDATSAMAKKRASKKQASDKTSETEAEQLQPAKTQVKEQPVSI